MSGALVPPVVWILIWVVVISAVAFFAVREHRSGRRVAPDAVRRRREDTFRMQSTREFYDVPEQNPDRSPKQDRD